MQAEREKLEGNVGEKRFHGNDDDIENVMAMRSMMQHGSHAER